MAGLVHGGALLVPAGSSASELVYKSCVTGVSGPGACRQTPTATSTGNRSGLGGVRSLALSPDGASLYTAAEATCGAHICSGDAAVARFDRNPLTGAIGFLGCITGDTNSGPSGSAACAAIPSASLEALHSGLDPVSLVVSPDGRSLYAASQGSCTYALCYGSNALARFDRDPRTGALTYRGCITGDERNGPSGSAACTQIPTATQDGELSGLEGPGQLVVSPDGASLYVTSGSDDAIVSFDRDRSTGALTYRGCITGSKALGSSGSGACTQIPTATEDGAGSGLGSPFPLALSSNGRSLYVSAYFDHAIARFNRDRSTGALTYRGCITGSKALGSSGSGACTQIPSATESGGRSGLSFLQSVVVSADGRSLYATAREDDAVASFDRDRSTGALTYRGCITGKKPVGPLGSGACAEIPSATWVNHGHISGYRSGLFWPGSVVVRGDGKALYVAGNNAIARFNRDRSTGALTYRGCITGSKQFGPSGSGACEQIPSAIPVRGPLALSADGKSLYALGYRNLVTRFAVAPQTRIIRGPKGRTRGHKATFRFRATARSVFRCKLTGKDVRPMLRRWRHCGSDALRHRGKQTYARLSRGRKGFHVRATDRSHTTDPTPGKRRWRVR
jgi:DNA-binding beta-propeller fold protein YncE